MTTFHKGVWQEIWFTEPTNWIQSYFTWALDKKMIYKNAIQITVEFKKIKNGSLFKAVQIALQFKLCKMLCNLNHLKCLTIQGNSKRFINQSIFKMQHTFYDSSRWFEL